MDDPWRGRRRLGWPGANPPISSNNLLDNHPINALRRAGLFGRLSPSSPTPYPTATNGLLRALVDRRQPAAPTNALLSALVDRPHAAAPTNALLSAVIDLPQPAAPSPIKPNRLLQLPDASRTPPSPTHSLGGLLQVDPKQRVVFFSFHFADSFRVNNVRNVFQFDRSVDLRFIDGSLWEKRKLDGAEAIKRLIREGMEGSSVVCVLVGSETWSRRWVKYEIARSIIDGKGLVAVHVNGIKHHEARTSHSRGLNPLTRMGVGKMSDGSYRLFEMTHRGWERYADFGGAVSLPQYLREPWVGYLTPLNQGTMEYDYTTQNGRQNMGGWLDIAAKLAGRK